MSLTLLYIIQWLNKTNITVCILIQYKYKSDTDYYLIYVCMYVGCNVKCMYISKYNIKQTEILRILYTYIYNIVLHAHTWHFWK